jgi:hypothetical protein
MKINFLDFLFLPSASTTAPPYFPGIFFVYTG